MAAGFAVVKHDIVADIAPQGGDIFADFEGLIGLWSTADNQTIAVILLHDSLLSQRAAMLRCDAISEHNRPARKW